MNLGQIHELYLKGESVHEPWEGDDPFECVLEMHEMEYDWRKVVLPLAVVGEKIDLSFEPNPGCEPEDEDERFDWIRSWCRDCGGVAQALSRKPPAIIMDDGQATMIDGRHRLAIAHAAGLTEVTVVIGMPHGFRPDPDVEFPAYPAPPLMPVKSLSARP